MHDSIESKHEIFGKCVIRAGVGSLWLARDIQHLKITHVLGEEIFSLREILQWHFAALGGGERLESHRAVIQADDDALRPGAAWDGLPFGIRVPFWVPGRDRGVFINEWDIAAGGVGEASGEHPVVFSLPQSVHKVGRGTNLPVRLVRAPRAAENKFIIQDDLCEQNLERFVGGGWTPVFFGRPYFLVVRCMVAHVDPHGRDDLPAVRDALGNLLPFGGLTHVRLHNETKPHQRYRNRYHGDPIFYTGGRSLFRVHSAIKSNRAFSGKGIVLELPG
jgi:hypothetical protein